MASCGSARARWGSGGHDQTRNDRYPVNRCLTALILIAVSTAANALQAGAARVELVPVPGTPLDGYAYRMGRAAVETHDPLWVRALYLEAGETKLFLVTSDLFAIGPDLRQRVLVLAPEVVPFENIILTATNTHNGPGGMARALTTRALSGPFMEDMLEETARAFAEAMRLAYEGRRRGTVGVGTATMRNAIVNRYDPNGPVDGQLGVIRVDDSDGNPIAIVANVPALPATVSKAFSFAFSADFPGTFYGALEEAVGGECVALFVNGAAGDQEFANPDGLEGWAFTEAIGRALARETKAVSDRIACTEATLTVRYAAPSLPLSIVRKASPQTAPLQALSIDDVLIAFVPGAPAAEIGLELRQRAQASYRAQLTVGFANDRIGTYVPKRSFGRGGTPADTNRYGPAMDEWLYSQIDALMKGEDKPAEDIDPAERLSVGSAEHVIVSGSAYRAGWQRGAAFEAEIRAAYEANVVARVHDGTLLPEGGLWSFAPGFVDQTPLAGAHLASRLRPLLGELAPSVIDELLGMADAVRLPFDAVWLLQCAPDRAQTKLDAEPPITPGTLFAVTGARAGADDLLVGHNVDRSAPEPAVIVETHPESGHAYIQVGFAWNAGVYSGMNDAGLVVCVEQVAPVPAGEREGPPVHLILRDVLRNEGDTAGAIDRIRSAEGLTGYHVLVADPNTEQAVVIELGARVSLRTANDGLLLAVDPGADDLDAETAGRYARVTALLAEERIVSVGEVQSTLLDRERGVSASARVHNPATRHSVVFEPKSRTIHVAFPEADGSPGAFHSITLKRGAP